MAKLINEFSNFHELIKIGNEAAALREKRDKLKSDFQEYFPSECKVYDITINKSDLRFINQGSYKIGTTIVNPDGSIDLDYAVIFPLDITAHPDSREIKKAAREALKIENIRVPKIKEPCITVGYHQNGEEYMHIDFPLYAEHKNQLYLARGKEFSSEYKWESADPEGLNEYFLNKFASNEQLRRIIRFVKKWKIEKYNNSTNSHEVPPSVALTILACENYVNCVNGSDDYDMKSLYETLKKIKNQFSITRDKYDNIIKADIYCQLPVTPRTDVLYKMRSSNSHLILLYERVCRAVENLENAVNLDSEHEAAKEVQKVLGSEFEVPQKNVSTANASSKREHSFG